MLSILEQKVNLTPVLIARLAAKCEIRELVLWNSQAKITATIEEEIAAQIIPSLEWINAVCVRVCECERERAIVAVCVCACVLLEFAFFT